MNEKVQISTDTITESHSKLFYQKYYGIVQKKSTTGNRTITFLIDHITIDTFPYTTGHIIAATENLDACEKSIDPYTHIDKHKIIRFYTNDLIATSTNLKDLISKYFTDML